MLYKEVIVYQIQYFKTVDEIKLLESTWDELYGDNKELSPFQSYLYNKCIIENKIYKGRLLFAVLYKDGKLIIITPLVRKNKILYKELYFLGKNTHSDYLNFIYNNEIEFRELEYLITHLLNNSRNTILKCDFINESSLISKFIEGMDANYVKNQTECIKIPIYKTEEEYLGFLGRSTKKEIKHKQNYLEKNLSDVRFDFLERKTLDEKLISELMNLYSERRKEKNNSINEKYRGFLANYIRKNNNNFLSICRVDGKIAAYNLGYITSSNNICVLIVAIDSKYKKYNIGNLLLYNTICHLIKQNACLSENSITYNYYDLTRGTELYKYKYGGIEYLNYNYIISKSKLLLLFDNIISKADVVFKNPGIILNKIKNMSKRAEKLISHLTLRIQQKDNNKEL